MSIHLPAESMRHVLLATVLAIVPAGLSAQTPGPLVGAAETITAQALAKHVSVIADDSMLGRATPSRGLDLTAHYVADQFRQLGLTPGGEHGTWFQHYTIPAHIDFARSQVVFTVDSTTATANLATAALLLKPTARKRRCEAVLVAGHQRVESLVPEGLRGKCVVYVPPPEQDAASQQVLDLVRQASLGLIVLRQAPDSADFERRLQAARQRLYLDWHDDWSVEVRPERATKLRDVLGAAGVALAQVGADTTPVVRKLPSLRIALDLQFDQSDGDTASNVIGILQGSDSTRQNEYVVFLAHMDHSGVMHGRPDSIANGANDDASGTAALIELARAFSRPGARPARSLAFVATSGHTTALAGSEAFAERATSQAFNLAFKNAVPEIMQSLGCSNVIARPNRRGGVSLSCAPDTIPEQIAVSSITAAVNLDQIGRASGDSVVVSGLGDVEFATPPTWVAAGHPELQLTVVDGGTAIAPESDQFSLARRGIPSLYVHDRLGPHTEGPDSTDSPKMLEYERAARIVRLAMYVGFAIADAKAIPHWTLQGRQEFLEHTAD